MRTFAPLVTVVPALLAGGLFARGVAELALHASVPVELAAIFAPKPAIAATSKGSLVKAVVSAEPKPVVAAVLPDPVPCTMPGRVVVTVADPDLPSRSFAVVDAFGGKGMVRRGSVIGGRPVLAVTGSRVWLGGHDVCWLDGTAHTTKSEPANATPKGALPKGIERVDDSHVRLDRAMRDQLFETGGGDFVKTLRFAPDMVDGKIAGLRMLSVQPDSVLARLGLRTGDVLRSVNGMPIGGPEQLLELYGKLRASPHLDFEITRAGAKTVVSVEVV